MLDASSKTLNEVLDDLGMRKERNEDGGWNIYHRRAILLEGANAGVVWEYLRGNEHIK